MQPAPIKRLLAVLLLLPTSALAKPPTLDRLFPPGAQRGQTIEVSAEGNFDPWPPHAWVLGSGVQVHPADDKGKLSIAIDPHAPAGLVWLRLYNNEGASALKPFLIGTLPEITEAEPNDEPSGAQSIDPPSATINGRLAKSGDVDGYALSLLAGQTLLASVQANRLLGSPMDAVLQVATPDGLVVAQEDDSGDLDPRLVFVAPETGSYIVRTFAFPATPNTSIRFSGGSDYLYRLTLTTGPFADYPMPLALPLDNPGWVGLLGWNLPDDARVLPVTPTETTPDLALAFHPTLPAPIPVPLVPHPVALEQTAPGDTPQTLTPPLSLSGRIASESERDLYQFPALKGQTLRIHVASRSLGFPLDPVLRILDADGKQLAESDDANRSSRDSELRFTPPSDGHFRLEIRDLNNRGGSRYVYRLDLLTPEPDVALTLKTDRFTLSPDKPLEIPVAIDRQDGFDAPLTLSVDGLPEGVSLAPSTSDPKGKTAKSVTLTLSSASAPAWSGPIRITATADSLPAPRLAHAPIDNLESTTTHHWLTVLPPKEPEPKPADPGD